MSQSSKIWVAKMNSQPTSCGSKITTTSKFSKFLHKNLSKKFIFQGLKGDPYQSRKKVFNIEKYAKYVFWVQKLIVSKIGTKKKL